MGISEVLGSGWEILPYLVLGGDLLVGQVGDRDLGAGRPLDLVLGPLAGLARVQQVTQRLVVDLHKAGDERVLREGRGG